MRQAHIGCALTVILLAFGSTVSADEKRSEGNNPHELVVISASKSSDGSTLFVTGRNFGKSPSVFVGDTRIGGVTVGDDGTTLTGIMPALPPGTYLLQVVK